jgi:hypothetical protein
MLATRKSKVTESYIDIVFLGLSLHTMVATTKMVTLKLAFERVCDKSKSARAQYPFLMALPRVTNSAA